MPLALEHEMSRSHLRGDRRIGGPVARGFTLIELMVVAAIIAVLLTVMAPAIKGLLQSSQLAQAENLLRAALYSARTYAVQKSVVAGVRFQEDGHMVQVYARNMSQMYSLDDYSRAATVKEFGGGRLAFGPGDRWPAMVKITVRVFDPLDRLDGGRERVTVMVVP